MLNVLICSTSVLSHSLTVYIHDVWKSLAVYGRVKRPTPPLTASHQRTCNQVSHTFSFDLDCAARLQMAVLFILLDIILKCLEVLGHPDAEEFARRDIAY